jgi:demethylmenaquinone methyltransferase/2-methoxy-6-polyprenyl-1,4-benzoquinol methylase
MRIIISLWEKMERNLASKMTTADFKRSYNRSHFGRAAANYDKATKLLSLGNDARWKSELIKRLPDIDSPRVLDLACGTGDLCFQMMQRYPRAEVFGVDLTPEMIQLAKERSSQHQITCHFEEGDISNLRYQSESFDIITASYAFRNAPLLIETVKGVSRLLKPGGVLGIIEFAKPDNRLLQNIQATTLTYWGGMWGMILDRTFASHSYIGASLRVFPAQSRFLKILDDHRLKLAQRQSKMLGCVEILVLVKQ